MKKGILIASAVASAIALSGCSEPTAGDATMQPTSVKSQHNCSSKANQCGSKSSSSKNGCKMKNSCSANKCSANSCKG